MAARNAHPSNAQKEIWIKVCFIMNCNGIIIEDYNKKKYRFSYCIYHSI